MSICWLYPMKSKFGSNFNKIKGSTIMFFSKITNNSSFSPVVKCPKFLLQNKILVRILYGVYGIFYFLVFLRLKLKKNRQKSLKEKPFLLYIGEGREKVKFNSHPWALGLFYWTHPRSKLYDQKAKLNSRKD